CSSHEKALSTTSAFPPFGTLTFSDILFVFLATHLHSIYHLQSPASPNICPIPPTFKNAQHSTNIPRLHPTFSARRRDLTTLKKLTPLASSSAFDLRISLLFFICTKSSVLNHQEHQGHSCCVHPPPSCPPSI